MFLTGGDECTPFPTEVGLTSYSVKTKFVQTLTISIWQETIGEDRDWDLVFVDNDPVEERTEIAERLFKRTKVLIIHDTEDSTINNYMRFPKDFM